VPERVELERRVAAAEKATCALPDQHPQDKESLSKPTPALLWKLAACLAFSECPSPAMTQPKCVPY
jgi:hypothetical protein